MSSSCKCKFEMVFCSHLRQALVSLFVLVLVLLLPLPIVFQTCVFSDLQILCIVSVAPRFEGRFHYSHSVLSFLFAANL